MARAFIEESDEKTSRLVAESKVPLVTKFIVCAVSPPRSTTTRSIIPTLNVSLPSPKVKLSLMQRW